MKDLLRALAVMVEPPGDHTAGVAAALGLPATPTAADHTHLFAFQLYPYASVYVGPDGMLGGEARDRVAGFLRALDVTPPAEPDHVATLLGGFAELADATPGEGPRGRARTALLHEHLLSWMPVWLTRVVDLGDPTHRAWALLLLEVLEDAATVSPTATGAAMLPLHLRAAPPMPDPRANGTRTFLDALLVPVRTGVVVTSTDLARAGRDTGLSTRVAERRYVLDRMVEQDAGALLAWFATFAREAADRYDEVAGWWTASPTGAWWQHRARATAALVDDVANEVAAVTR